MEERQASDSRADDDDGVDAGRIKVEVVPVSLSGSLVIQEGPGVWRTTTDVIRW